MLTKNFLILILFGHWTLLGQSILQDNLDELKSGTKTIKYTAEYLTRGSDSFGERFTISISQNDTSLFYHFTAGDFEVWDQLRENGKVTDLLSETLAEVESYYKKNSKEFDGWVSYWQIDVDFLNTNREGNNLGKFRCNERQIENLMNAVQTGLYADWKKLRKIK